LQTHPFLLLNMLFNQPYYMNNPEIRSNNPGHQNEDIVPYL